MKLCLPVRRFGRALGGMALVALLGAGWAAPTHAAGLAVTRFDDPPPNGCTAADCSLREAIIAANARPGRDTISLAPGIYALAIAGTGEDAAATGDLDIAGDLLLAGAGAAATTVDANKLDRALDIIGGKVTISGLAIQHGQSETAGSGGGIRNAGVLAIDGSAIISNTSGVQFDRADGGGIFSAGPLHLSNSTVRSNQAGQRGGGIAAHGLTTLASTVVADNYGWGYIGGIDSTGTLTMTDSIVSGNGSGEGGSGGVSNAGQMLIRRSIITRNNASDGSGGGIVNLTSGTLTIGESQITYNAGSGLESGGGGILNLGTLTVAATLIGHNTIAAWDGAGVANLGRATIAESTIEHNSTGEAGGGIANAGVMTLLGSTVSQNRAGTDGGGIANTGAFTATNSTISTNSATGAGSGIFNTGTLALESATITRNSHGLATQGTVKLHNSILAGNSDADCEGSIESQGYNLLGVIEPCSGGTAPGDKFGRIAHPLDPGLAPLAPNGGPTTTHMPLPGSPALDAGDPAACPQADQRGFARPFGTRCDIGAAERGFRVALPFVRGGL